MKSCELCKASARMYCESDQASLCWDCDTKVHSANFLVARHSRSLLCHACQSLTAWNACGAKLGRTVSVCESCVDNSGGIKDGERAEERGVDDDEIETQDEYDDDDDELGADEEDGDNQVVPWPSTPAPPAASSSSSEESSTRCYDGDRDIFLKRMRENVADLYSNDDLGRSSSQQNTGTAPPSSAAVARTATEDETAYVDSSSMRRLKSRRTEPNRTGIIGNGPADWRSLPIVEYLKRFINKKDMNAPSAISGICRLSKDPRAVHFDSSDSP